MLLKNPKKTGDRRGVILMVVLALLTLFAILGVTFVLYANAEATAARISREAEDRTLSNSADMSAQQALFLFLGQFIYDLQDPTSSDQSGGYSALRGHSLGRGEYGFNSTAGYTGNPYGTSPNNPVTQDDKPFIGTGRLHYASPFTKTSVTYANDDAYLVNYMYFASDGWLRDPERYEQGGRTDYTKPEGSYAGGANAPYTYPDHNNMFLAMMRASDGKVLMPSYHRPWLFGQYNPTATPPNPNLANAEGKYLTCLVRPNEMDSTFPTSTFDTNMLSVQNLPWGASNDSGWVDIGAPVLTTASGTKYKLLIAPLIVELDSKLNMNVVGNVMGSSNAHAGNQGWGPHEVNISQLLNASTATTEWQNIFLGNAPSSYTGPTKATINGRYGNGKLPKGTPLVGGTPARWWAQVDYNGTTDPPPGTATTALTLPTAGAASSYTCFPTFPTGYGNGPTNETQDSSGTQLHPLLFNSQRPGTDNRTFPVAGMYSLMNFLRSNSAGVTGDLARLCPTNYTKDSTDATCPKRRNLSTLISADLDRLGMTCYGWDLTDATTRYQYNTATNPLYPQQQPIVFPALSQLGTTPASSEFDSNTWRSTLAATYGRLDLNRTLTQFPPPDPNTGLIDMTQMANQTQVGKAVGDRQQFALDLFNALRAAAGALDVPTVVKNYTTTSNEYNALRYLAQLAVNIVDYIDYDDYNTAFNWDSSNAGWVYGTELPRLVLNEFYVSYDNDPIDPSLPGAASTYNTNVWVELHNPFYTDNVPNKLTASDGTSPRPDQQAILCATDPKTGNLLQTNYQVVLCKTNVGSVLRNAANVTGDPDFGAAPGTNAIRTVSDYVSVSTPPPQAQLKDYRQVTPSNPNGSYAGTAAGSGVLNGGFYVLGPDVKFYGTTNPNLPTTVLRPEMSYPTATAVASAAEAVTSQQPTVLLRRLACPGLPPNTNPTGGATPYNPYITVDYIEVPGPAASNPNQVNDGRVVNASGPVAMAPTITSLQSWGRTQPYTAGSSTPAAMTVPTAPLQYSRMPQNPQTQAANQPKHTFFRTNAVENNASPAPVPSTTPPTNPAGGAQTIKIPFDWLVHLDRQLISPVELLHVSGYKPHELTQQFVSQAGGASFSHRAPWSDQYSRLYRFFEMVETKCRANGVCQGGRFPGKININMVFDQEVFNALADAQTGNLYTAANVTTVFNQMIKQRSPTSDGGTGYMPGATDQPFWGLGVGPAAGGDPLGTTARGIDSTLLRGLTTPSTTATQRTFDPFAADANPISATNPYLRLQLLTKLYNNLTTRSNVYAVWLTTGFFQLADQVTAPNLQTQPIKLGVELGAATGQQVRHHMFAIVDRTNLQCFSTTTTAQITSSSSAANLSLSSTSYTHSYTSRQYTVQAGSVLVYEPNTDNEETVVVQNNGGTLQAVFTKSHGNGSTVIVRGFPGPWPNYDANKDPAVVPFYYIID